MFWANQVSAQYCASNATLTADSKCDLVVLNGDSQSINNATGGPCQTYSDHTALPAADLTQTGNYTVSVTNGTCGGDYTRLANVWIDWNQDLDFDDANEMLGTGSSSSNVNGFVHNINFNVPAGASLGNTRMRVILLEGVSATDPCAVYSYGETEDYTVTILASAPMSFVSSTTTSASTSTVENCATNAEVLRVEVVTSGSGSPFDLTDLRVQTNGSTNPLNDLTSVDVYYTGSNPSFSASNYFGSAAPAATGVDIDISGSQQLVAGSNYFWLVYDIDNTSTVGNVVDATCSRLVVNSTNQFPSTSAPAGNRQIIDCTMSCPTTATVLDEQFEVNPIGIIAGTIYGGGTHNGAAYIISGTRHGWFNLVNGVGNVDVYDRHVDGLMVGCNVTVSYWARKTYGVTSVEFNMYDDNGALLAQNVQADLSATYVQYTHTFTATTPGMRFVLHFNSTGGSGIDVALEDLLITQCCDMPSALPVNLNGFEVNCSEEDVELLWYTSNEVSNDYFTIERSRDGELFEFATTIKGNGTNSSQQSYSWVDHQASQGTNYYRLSQTDFNGQTTYFDTRSINCDVKAEVSIFPNPFQDEASLTSQTEGMLYLLDISGKVVLTQNILAGSQTIDLKDLSSGVYTAKIILSNGELQTIKLMKS